MKTLKLIFFSLAMTLLVFTSCTNNESIIEEQQNTEESESITTTLYQLRTQFDDNRNVTQADNPAGNIVLDFCFDFVYPLNLSYNNGTAVTVNNLNNLVDVMFSSTENLYINGIAFPFNVETYNDSTNTIEAATINNEEEFVNLLENCDFDNFEQCICTQEAFPVCVEIIDPNGDTFTVTYPNPCYAGCYGFTQEDFIDNCEGNYYSGGTCYSLNFPLSIIVNNDATVVINSEEELTTTLYNVYVFDYVYPFTVTLENGNVVEVNNADAIETLITDCNGCPCPANVDPVCVEIEQADGTIITFPYNNACLALCDGYTEADFVYCNSGNDLCLPSAITTALLDNTGWVVSDINGSQELDIYEITFNSDGTLQWTSNEASFSGTWSVEENPVDGNILTLSFSGPNLQQATGQWRIVDCDLPCSISLLLNNGNEMELSRACD